MNKNRRPSYNVIPFANEYNHISPSDLSNIFESLDDLGYLSDKGKDFKGFFWRLFIKEK